MAHQVSPTIWTPGRVFYFGLALVLLATWLPFIPSWTTFVHMWRVDLAASVFLLITLGYLVFHARKAWMPISVSPLELKLIVLPMLAFIAWSAISTIWAPSWKSSLHHTFLWAEYLLFYFIARHAVDHDGGFDKLLKTVTAVLVLFAIPALIEFVALTLFGGETFFRARFAKYGEQIATLLPILMVAVLRSSGTTFRYGVASVALMWLLVYCTAGKVNLLLFGGCVAAVGILVFAFARFHRYRLKFAFCVAWLAIATLPFILLSLAASSNVPILSRMQDTTGAAYSRDFRVLMNSVSLEMIATRPITGVGADNYGLQFNNYREQYAAANPTDANLSYGEIGIVGHAHNEYLQIAAELGLVGSVIFAWFLVGIAVLAWRALVGVRHRPPFYIAAVVGLLMFLASSAVSAYSFRLMQNGIVFFIVLAVAAKGLMNDRSSVTAPANSTLSPARLRLAFAAPMLVCLGLATYSAIRVSSVAITSRANHTADLAEASTLYTLAMSLDDENPDVRNNFAMRYFQEDRFAESAPLLEESVRIGRAQSVDFSYLASAYSLAGDDRSSENAMARAARLYPKSAFVLTRHAVLLQKTGDQDASEKRFTAAREIDLRAANSWWTMINSGAQEATNRAVRSPDYKPVMDLQPLISMYAVLDERHIRFPAERLIFKRR